MRVMRKETHERADPRDADDAWAEGLIQLTPELASRGANVSITAEYTGSENLWSSEKKRVFVALYDLDLWEVSLFVQR